LCRRLKTEGGELLQQVLDGLRETVKVLIGPDADLARELRDRKAEVGWRIHGEKRNTGTEALSIAMLDSNDVKSIE
jgi:hypothetical protein